MFSTFPDVLLGSQQLVHQRAPLTLGQPPCAPCSTDHACSACTLLCNETIPKFLRMNMPQPTATTAVVTLPISCCCARPGPAAHCKQPHHAPAMGWRDDSRLQPRPITTRLLHPRLPSSLLATARPWSSNRHNPLRGYIIRMEYHHQKEPIPEGPGMDTTSSHRRVDPRPLSPTD